MLLQDFFKVKNIEKCETLIFFSSSSNFYLLMKMK